MIVSVRVVSALLLAASVSAPVQCGSKVRPEHRFEEEPSEALYQLAARLRDKGDRAGRVETLRFIIERYPTSRFAEAAKIDLAELGETGPPAAPSTP